MAMFISMLISLLWVFWRTSILQGQSELFYKRKTIGIVAGTSAGSNYDPFHFPSVRSILTRRRWPFSSANSGNAAANTSELKDASSDDNIKDECRLMAHGFPSFGSFRGFTGAVRLDYDSYYAAAPPVEFLSVRGTKVSAVRL